MPKSVKLTKELNQKTTAISLLGGAKASLKSFPNTPLQTFQVANHDQRTTEKSS
jgi:hypothetical protein